ncbi:hypothetical protein FA15DRAFT_697935 [Coprinopsis marcescibilis]|uniref:Uncharacterized protein n=1 Tax=Coprinopsis marcescibilis TaxID=230819 RepID=A0A5C3KFB2_COPMA|nr:hypothetical protein FA15DRAFT_697935 [Coprinopsis marcescibilis]
MPEYGQRVRERLAALLEDPLSFPSTKQFIHQTYFSSSPCKPDESMPTAARNDSGAQYLMSKDGSAVTMKFAATWDRSGMFDKTNTPYFNTSNTKGEPRDVEKNINRLRTAIELRPLGKDDRLAHCYPDGTLRASNAAFKSLLTIQQQLKKDRKTIPDENYITFIRPIRNEDRFVMLATSHSLLPSLQKAADDIPSLSLDDIDSDDDEDDGPLSPTKMKGKLSDPDPSNNSASSSKNTVLPRDMPDPVGQYALTGPALNAEVVPPKIYNGKGEIVHPKDYNTLDFKNLVIAEVTICWQVHRT